MPALLYEFITIKYYFLHYIDSYLFLVPLGVIGIWRWSVWVVKELIGLHYRPKTKPYAATVSLVIPVYNEDPETFTKALHSWLNNKPKEIIAVIDASDKACITIFKQFAKKHREAILITTTIPGKRPALAHGIQRATAEIVTLVDSDTIWDEHVIRNGLPPFHDPKVAGVATYQSVLNPKTFAQKIFDVQLDLRYRHEYPFLAAAGNALVCLSGRTAFYRKAVILPMLPDLVHETFLGKPVISGDDKRLTYLVLQAGWKVAYQSSSHVYTPGMKDMKSYLQQRLRWSRNSLRADMKALWQGWPIKHPALLFFQIDKFLQSFVVILSPIFFFVSLYYHFWFSAAIIFCWWFVSRTVKMYAHILSKPTRFTIIPGYVLYSFFSGIVRIYAFFTLNTQGWITRWDTSRLPQIRFITELPAYAATASVLVMLTYGVTVYKQHTYIIPHTNHELIVAKTLPLLTSFLPKKAVAEEKKGPLLHLLTKRYVTTEGETLLSIGEKMRKDPDTLLHANNAKVASIYQLLPQGMLLTLPGKDTVIPPSPRFERLSEITTPLHVLYDPETNTLVVKGRQQTVTLADIATHGGEHFLMQESPKVWYTTASIFLSTGVTLVLNKKEVTWLKLESNPKQFAIIRSRDGDISMQGVKITSWNKKSGTYDTNIADGRSFVMVKGTARMDIENSELAYLGYATSPDLTVSPYGVSWKMSTNELKKEMLTGEVRNSRFHDNYFGAYTYGATGITWNGNEFYHNIKYGLDPHDDSNGFLVENNKAYDNGSHGIIFSKRCIDNVIRKNLSYHNVLHGIMLHESSNNNIVEDNVLDGNTSGVALWHSKNNIVRNNTITNNRHGVRANATSEGNTIANNTITGSSLYGLYLYDNANHNLFSHNVLRYNKVGMYIKSNDNTLTQNKLYNNNIGIYFLANAAQNMVDGNTIEQSLTYGIYAKISQSLSNPLGKNVLANNRKDIRAHDATN